MNLSLRPEVQRLIDERLRTGQYSSVEDIVAAAMVSLEQQERFGDFASGELDELMAEGERSIEEGGTLDGEQAFEQRRQRRAERR